MFDDAVGFRTASFMCWTHRTLQKYQTDEKSSLTDKEKSRLLGNWDSLAQSAQTAIDCVCWSPVEILTQIICEVVDEAQSHHGLSTYVHFMKADDDKFDQDRYLALTQQHGLGADDESVSECEDDKDGEKEEDHYPSNPFVDDEAVEAGVHQNESEVSSEEVFDSLDDTDEDECISALVTAPKKKGDNCKEENVIIPTNLFGSSVAERNDKKQQGRPTPPGNTVKENLGQLRTLMLEFINFSLLDTNKEFLEDDGCITGNLGYLRSYREQCKAFYTMYGIKTPVNVDLEHKLFLPLWVHHYCQHPELPGEAAWANTIITDILSRPIKFDDSDSKESIKVVVQHLLGACTQLEKSYVKKCVQSLGNFFMSKEEPGSLPLGASQPKEKSCLTDAGVIVIKKTSKTSRQRESNLSNHHEGDEMEHKEPRRSPRKTKYSGRFSAGKAIGNGDHERVNRKLSHVPINQTNVSSLTDPASKGKAKKKAARSTISKTKYTSRSQAERPQKRTKK